ncbi:MAG: phosphate acyltransferase PlsX [Helicobacteraceae bacterium]|jgi:glycerol-3-phosphate acyltransferase PlsX|nr:phosphate acyltransferase PlsX [Helicobacteraceae bacterium]
MSKVRVAIDAMGGDFGCEPIVAGVAQALESADFEAILVGDKAKILERLPAKFHDRAIIVEASDEIAMSDQATDALKRKESSIYKTVDLVAKKSADAAVSAGHSGATMSLATLKIGRLKGVSRPAIATLMPTSVAGKHTLVLDVGANVDSEPKHLFQSAIMGHAYASKLLKIDDPKVALLANGEEDGKGDKLVKESFELLKQARSKGFNFVGNAEGGDIFNGHFDVIVCDGFVGNVLLKTSEGLAKAIVEAIRQNVKKSPLAILGYLLMKPAFRALKKSMDYDEYGGAPLVGVNGSAIISHGKSTPKAIKNACLTAISYIESNVNALILKNLERFSPKPEPSKNAQIVDGEDAKPAQSAGASQGDKGGV